MHPSQAITWTATLTRCTPSTARGHTKHCTSATLTHHQEGSSTIHRYCHSNSTGRYIVTSSPFSVQHSATRQLKRWPLEQPDTMAQTHTKKGSRHTNGPRRVANAAVYTSKKGSNNSTMKLWHVQDAKDRRRNCNRTRLVYAQNSFPKQCPPILKQEHRTSLTSAKYPRGRYVHSAATSLVEERPIDRSEPHALTLRTNAGNKSLNNHSNKN